MSNTIEYAPLSRKTLHVTLPVAIGLWIITMAFYATADQSVPDPVTDSNETVMETDDDAAGSSGYNVEMEEMVVIGSRSVTDKPEQMSVPVQVVTREQIKAVGAVSLAQALEVIQSVELVQCPDLNASPGVQTLRLRGMDANHVLVLIDGRRQPGARPDNQGFSYTDISTISIDNIERIEVLRDGASAQYGSDAVAGVINIITRKNSPRLNVNSQYGISSRSDGEEKHLDLSSGFPLGDRFFLNLSAFGKHIDSYDRTPDNPRWTTPEIDQTGTHLNLSWEIDHRQMADVDLRYNQTETVFRRGTSGNVPQDRISKKKDLHSGVNWGGDFTSLHLDAGAALSTSDTEYRHSEEPDYNGDLESLWSDAYVHLSWPLQSWLSFFVGADYNREDVDSPQRNFVESRDTRALFTEVSFNPLRSLTIQLSGRMENHSDFGTHFAPKLSGSYEILSGLTMRASISSSYQVPTLFQLHDRFIGAMGWNDIYGNPDLDPSQGVNLNLGVVYKPFKHRDMRFSIDGFQNRIDNFIETEVISAKTATENAVTTYVNLPGTSTFEGVEADLDIGLAYGFHLNANGTYLVARDPDGNDLTNRPRSRFNVVLGYGVKDRLQVNLRYTYRGIYLDDKTPGKKIEPFDYFSAHVDLTLRPWIAVYLGARNIFDEEPPVDPEDYESGHMESMLDSTQGAFYYSGVRLTF